MAIFGRESRIGRGRCQADATNDRRSALHLAALVVGSYNAAGMDSQEEATENVGKGAAQCRRYDAIDRACVGAALEVEGLRR